ncbi:heavy metal transport/detoxification protein [Chitinophaga sp.]|uniref:heavy-metal-associated domain-containing protein n=1 Tax=Chitinophaga sp. TaxID=1869181 RepID=UPI0031CFA716
MQFKTNIKCDACVAKVTPYLDKAPGKDAWKVDTTNPDKILTVNDDKGLSAADVIKQVEAAGYKASEI